MTPPEGAKIRMVTLEEANALIPQVRETLRSLRQDRDKILRTQAQIEIEEMTGSNARGALSPSAQAAITKHMDAFHQQTRQFEEKLTELAQSGALLKDLDSGLVDFYSRKGTETIFLCWKEDEDEVGHWHSLEGGFRNRRPLP